MKYLFSVILLLLSVLPIQVSAQEQEKSLEVGLRDNQFAHFNFLGESGWIVGYEQSLMNVKMKEQTGRLFVGQTKDWQHFGYTWTTYAGMDYHRSYGMYGALASARCRLWRFLFDATLNPNYDTGYKFQMNYDAGASFNLFPTHGIALCASYGNLPEFRNNINYCRLGMKLTSSDENLWVKPEVCLPNIGKGSEYLRVLVSLGWRLGLE